MAQLFDCHVPAGFEIRWDSNNLSPATKRTVKRWLKSGVRNAQRGQAAEVFEFLMKGEDHPRAVAGVGRAIFHSTNPFRVPREKLETLAAKLRLFDEIRGREKADNVLKRQGSGYAILDWCPGTARDLYAEAFASFLDTPELKEKRERVLARLEAGETFVRKGPQ